MIKQSDFNPFQKEIIEILSYKFPESFNYHNKISSRSFEDWFDISKTHYGIDVSNETGKNLFIEIIIPDIENLERKKEDNTGRKYMLGLSDTIIREDIPNYFENLTDLSRYFVSKSGSGGFAETIKRIQNKEKGIDNQFISDLVIGDIKQINNLLGQNKLKEARKHLTKYDNQQFQLTDYEFLLVRQVHFQTRKLYFMKQTFLNLTSEDFDKRYSFWNQQVGKILDFLQEKRNVENKLEEKVFFGKIFLNKKLKKLNRAFLEFPEFVP